MAAVLIVPGPSATLRKCPETAHPPTCRPSALPRAQVPARFVDASGLQPFDLDSFLSMAQRNRKWQDPTTLNNSSVEQLQARALAVCCTSC